MLLEKDLEAFLIQHPDVIEEELQLVGQQQRVAGKRIDLLFESKAGEVVVVEVKRIANRKDIAQLFDYAGYFLGTFTKRVRVVLVAFEIPRNFKNTFDFFGIEYREVSETLLIPSPLEKESENMIPLPAPNASEREGANSTRRGMAKRLRKGLLCEQASLIMRLLDEKQNGLVMSEIAAYMKSKGYTSKSYYDLCNALSDVGSLSKQKTGRTFAYSLPGD